MAKSRIALRSIVNSTPVDEEEDGVGVAAAVELDSAGATLPVLETTATAVLDWWTAAAVLEAVDEMARLALDDATADELEEAPVDDENDTDDEDGTTALQSPGDSTVATPLSTNSTLLNVAQARLLFIGGHGWQPGTNPRLASNRPTKVPPSTDRMLPVALPVTMKLPNMVTEPVIVMSLASHQIFSAQAPLRRIILADENVKSKPGAARTKNTGCLSPRPSKYMFPLEKVTPASAGPCHTPG